MAQECISSFDLDFVDDFYFSALFDEEQGGGGGDIFEVSDDMYAEELQFQEVLMGSVIVSQMKNNDPSSMMIQGPPVLLSISDQPMHTEIIQSGAGESSLSFCEICVERKETGQMFKTESCVHSFCNDCICRHVATKVQDGTIIVTCPGLNCRAVLELDNCRPIMTREVIDLWEDALCEEVIDATQRFYCPFKDCSALLIHDNEGEAIIESECPFCHRLFCAQCSVPWHSGIECDEFQRLNEDERGREDIMLRELANDKKWSRCPQCKFYVERTDGCPHMLCRLVLSDSLLLITLICIALLCKFVFVSFLRLIIISGVGLSFAMDVEKNGAQLMVDALGNKKQCQVWRLVIIATSLSGDNSESERPQWRLSQQSSWEDKEFRGKDYLYRLGKEADSMNIADGARAGVIDPFFSGNFLGKDSDIVFDYRQKVTRIKLVSSLDLSEGEETMISYAAGKMSCLMINDIDAGLGRFGYTQMTVNNQIAVGTLMNLSNNPKRKNLGKRLLQRKKDGKRPVFTPPEVVSVVIVESEKNRSQRKKRKVKGLAGLKSIAVRVVGGFSRRRKAKKKTKVGDKLMDMLHKMIFPVRRVWLGVSARLRTRKNGAGLLKLHNDVQTCGYEDVQVMWEILRRSESELMASLPKRKQRPFWRVFVWSNHSAASSFSANHS
ncbi:hypothetical protein SADUNF_Sadunf03G0144400 [Salix dunnii]|uniref:RBR-type E3 ubiquitin transferase n=1 Tax=Salix dunnii TaxID=1413687 RepID=A0A835N4V8_9ROSI|nr:hypothetical protein SADUNF_Sadunf03G0144400 [Salix dunnii]